MEKIIVRELAEMKNRSNAEGALVLLPTLGGQTGLNTAMELFRTGVLEKHDVEMIGAKADAIERGEDRERFKDLMLEIGLDVPDSGIAHNIEEAWAIADKIGKFPLIIRPAYTLGGTGGGIAYNREEFEELAKKGVDLSPVNEILVEESLIGWKEFEMEVMRDKADNCVIICSIENFDPMGVHTGDSITVAPIQTLDRQGISNYARREFRHHPRCGRGDRRLQHPVFREPRQRPDDCYRNEPTRESQLRARLQGHRISDCENRRQARHWLHPR